jgi:hypothetical protein
MKLTDEEVVIRFFRSIDMKPHNKDNYIKDFEDFYFKIRPKYGQKLIKLLLEVRLKQIKVFRVIQRLKSQVY